MRNIHPTIQKSLLPARITLTPLVIVALLFLAHPDVQAEWVKDGVPICSSSGDQWYGYITPDGSGGAFITWSEIRSDVPYDNDVYAQRIDRAGNILWASEGVPISVVSGSQQDPQIVQDGTGGVLIAWRDQRGQYYRVYAQRLDGDGNIQWTSNGVSVCESLYPQYGPLMVPDGLGNFYITWRDDRHGYGQVYCQKLDGNGNLLWPATGVRVCPTLGWQDWPKIISDTEGGAIIAWHDERYGFMSHYIYAQRLDGNGNVLWGAAGAPICLFDYPKWSLDCIADGQGGGIVAWHGYGTQGGGGYEVYAQRFNSSGAILWTPSGVPVSEAANDQSHPHLVSDDAGGAIIAWLDARDEREDIYAQRVLSDGSVAWQTDGMMVREGPPKSGFGYSVPDIVRDEVGGAILAWQEGPGPDDLWDIVAQRVDAEGNLLWPDSVVSVCRAPGGQFYPQMTVNGEGGAILTWRDMRNGTKGAVYAIRVTANGETVATLLQSFTALYQDAGVEIRWKLSEPVLKESLIIERAEGPKAFSELPGAEIIESGLDYTFRDTDIDPGMKYRYRVVLVKDDGSRENLFETEEIAIPQLPLTLYQNHPNPFNPSTTIRYYLPEGVEVTLGVYDAQGRLVVSLVDGQRQLRGYRVVEWNGRDGSGRAAASGVYFYRLKAGKLVKSRKMILVR